MSERATASDLETPEFEPSVSRAGTVDTTEAPAWSLRIGGLLAITGLVLALLLSSVFVVLGGVLMVFGGIGLALGMEPLLADHDRESVIASESAGTERTDIAA